MTQLYNSRMILALLLALVLQACSEEFREQDRSNPHPEYPGEWMYQQRAFPFDRINAKVYQAAILQVQQARRSQRSLSDPWQAVGPYNIGGRITDIALHPADQNTIYIGSANGGVFKTSDMGQTWDHIFVEDGRLAIGNIALSAADPDVLYIGTGEANGSATSGAFFGDGVYRTDNGGDTWVHLGLSESHHIGRIIIDPEDPYRVFVAASGHLYGKNPERGIYRSEDGGEHWEQVLFVSDSTSAIDIACDPRYPDTLYAALWERLRYAHVRDYAGLTSGVYRSTDGGDTWQRLTAGLPVHEEVGRIGLTVGPDGAVYVTVAENPITNDFRGLYKSTDFGMSWNRVDDQFLETEEIYSGFGWYFGNVRVHPANPDEVYILGLRTWRSNDGGVSWVRHSPNYVHVDHHALEFHALNPDMQVLGTDGGLYISVDAGFSWSHIETLPVTEFYTCEIDESMPNRYYGGTQDNGTMRTLTGSQDDWERIFGGDGFYVIVDPLDNNIIYCEFQWGNLYKSVNGGMDFDWSLEGVSGFDRRNWNTPVVLSPHNHNRLYYGTQRLYTSDDAAVTWNPISEDLTNTDPGSPGGEGFGALSTIAVAPSDSNVIYTGSEDGYVYVTMDHGATWTRISDDLPIRHVTRVAVDPYDAMTAYVTISGYKDLDYLPHIFQTTDGGGAWSDISGNLPEVPINDVVVDPDFPATLYVATDLDVWYTDNYGLLWFPLGEELPMTSFADLRFHQGTRQLLAASFGLSQFIYDLTDPVTSAGQARSPVQELRVYPNPATDRVTVEFTLSGVSVVNIVVSDLSGKKTGKLKCGRLEAGHHVITYDDLPTGNGGMYLLTVEAEGNPVSRIIEVL